MKIQYSFPDTVVRQIRQYSDNPKVIQDVIVMYLDHLTGVTYGAERMDFREWAENFNDDIEDVVLISEEAYQEELNRDNNET